MSRHHLLVVTISAWFVESSQAQTVFYVDDNAAQNGDGLSWSSPYRYLQDALAVAIAGDQIRVAGGVYLPDRGDQAPVVLGDREAAFVPASGVIVRGAFAGLDDPSSPDLRSTILYESVLSGDLTGDDQIDFVNNAENSYHVMRFQNQSTGNVVDGCTIRSGNANGPCCDLNGGGAVTAIFASPTFIDCKLVENFGQNDGAARLTLCTSRFERCVFADNRAGSSGGALSVFGESLRAAHCTFLRNSAGGGGALNGSGGRFEVVGCSFLGNQATAANGGEGGAIRWIGANNAPRRIVCCLFDDNRTTGSGGGIFLFAGTPETTEIANCVFSRNSADFGGAAAAVLYPLHFTNCTIAGNLAGVRAAAILLGQNSGGTTVRNSIIYGNLPATNQIAGDAPPVAARFCIIEGGYAGAQVMNVDPRFVDPFKADYHVLADSPAIDRGCNSAVLLDDLDLDADGVVIEATPFDVDGASRFVDILDVPDSGCGLGSVVDIGAYERGSTGNPPCIGDVDGNGSVDLGDLASLLSGFGSAQTCGEGDLDCDGNIGLADLARLLGTFGNVCD